MDDIKKVMLEPKDTEEKGMNWTYYLLQKNGGVLWPAAYFLMLWRAWPSLGEGWRMGFFVGGAVGIMTLFVCLIFGRWYIGSLKKTTKEVVGAVELRWSEYVTRLNRENLKTALSLDKEKTNMNNAVLRLRIITGVEDSCHPPVYKMDTQEGGFHV